MWYDVFKLEQNLGDSDMKKIINYFNNMSLLNKFIISYLLIMVIPITVSSLAYYRQSAEKVESDYKHILRDQLLQVRNHSVNKINQLILSAKTLSENSYVIKYLEHYNDDPYTYFLSIFGDLGTYIDSIKEINPNIYHLRIYAKDPAIPRYKDIIYHMGLIKDQPWYPEVEKLKFNFIYWEQLHEFDEIHFLENQFPSRAGVNVYTLYQKIYSANSSDILGFLELNIAQNVLFDVIDSYSDNTHFYLWEKNMTPVSLTTDQSIQSFSFRPEDFTSSSGSFNTYMGNGKFIVLYETIEPLQTKLVLVYPYKLITTEVHDKMSVFLFISLVSIIAIILITSFISRRIFRRMDILTKHMKKIQDGNFDAKIDIDYMDEVGQIKKAFNIMVDKVDNLINTVYKTELAEKEATLSYLQAQMDPHFLFNSLEAIRMTAEIEKDYKVSDALVALSNVLKMRIRADAFIDVSEEINVIKSFIHIANIRFNHKIVFEENISNRFRGFKIPALTLQPIVENSIVHGFEQKKADCLIILDGQVTDNRDLEIYIHDNGSGIPPSILEKMNEKLLGNSDLEYMEQGSTNIGLYNVCERVRLYFGRNYGLSISSNTEGTTVLLTLPLEHNMGK